MRSLHYGRDDSVVLAHKPVILSEAEGSPEQKSEVLVTASVRRSLHYGRDDSVVLAHKPVILSEVEGSPEQKN